MPSRLDDPSISDDDLLWRRIVNNPIWIIQNLDGTWRVTSAAFLDDYTGEVSAHLAKLTTQERALSDRLDDGLVELEASVPRALSHVVVSDPTEDDPSHTLICPPAGQSEVQRKSAARKMAEAAQWLIYPASIRI